MNNCARCGRDNCTRKSEIHGYICEGCLRELIFSGVDTDIAQFMANMPVALELIKNTNFFNRIFVSIKNRECCKTCEHGFDINDGMISCRMQPGRRSTTCKCFAYRHSTDIKMKDCQ